MKDLYNILEVSPRASEEVILAAYRALAKKSEGDGRTLYALNEAKETLLDPSKKAHYDLDRAPKGKMIGQYRLVRAIAEGGFGTTYEAIDTSVGLPVCLKHAHKIGAIDTELLKEEAKAVWDLSHFALPVMRGGITLDDGSYALVMSYVPGPTLAQLVEDNGGGLDPEHVAWITERILNGLRYLHFHGVVHADIKPHNIIVQPDEHMAKLIDYGLSAVKPTSSSTAKGYTDYFAPPEQVLGKVPVPATDFYSLGMTMIFALGGDVRNKAVPSDVPDPLCKFVQRLIVRNVLDRPDWREEDLLDTLGKVRVESFGSRRSNFKPLKVKS